MPGTESEGRERVPEIVDASRGRDPGNLLRRPPSAVPKVVEVEVAATRGRKQERAFRVRPPELVEGGERDRLQGNRTHARLRLRRLEAAVSERAADVDDLGLSVDIPVLECEPLPRPQAGGRGEQHHRAVTWAETVDEGVELIPESNGRFSV
jgi:hypothetical protein